MERKVKDLKQLNKQRIEFVKERIKDIENIITYYERTLKEKRFDLVLAKEGLIRLEKQK